MTIKDYLVCEEAKKEIESILEQGPPKERPTPKKRPVLGRLTCVECGEKAREGSNYCQKCWSDKFDPSKKQDNYDLLPMLSKQDNRKLKVRIKMLKLLGDKDGVEEMMKKINQRRREHNIPQLTPDGVKTALAAVKDMPPFGKETKPDKDFTKKSKRYTDSTGPR